MHLLRKWWSILHRGLLITSRGINRLLGSKYWASCCVTIWIRAEIVWISMVVRVIISRTLHVFGMLFSGFVPLREHHNLQDISVFSPTSGTYEFDLLWLEMVCWCHWMDVDTFGWSFLVLLEFVNPSGFYTVISYVSLELAPRPDLVSPLSWIVSVYNIYLTLQVHVSSGRCCEWSHLEGTCNKEWCPRSGRFLGPMVRTLPYDCAPNWRDCQAVCRQG